jgi:hypothetical protein
MYASLPKAEQVWSQGGKELILWGAEELTRIPQGWVPVLGVRLPTQISLAFAWTNLSKT